MQNISHLFTYGSLMCEDIMVAVAGEPLRHTPARLFQYRRYSVKNEQYPGIVPNNGSVVDGIVYQGITPAIWSRLDRFEGEMYCRRPVTVLLENGAEAQVYCYVFRPEFRQRLTDEEWDLQTFLRQGKKIFQTRYSGFKDIQ
jgi:gamma-glutamylcyclotransferase (GGCT)/AIG2-like uncharacterized protein YtfP